MRFTILLFLVFSMNLIGNTQSLEAIESTTVENLKFYADIMANAGNADHRVRAQREFDKELKTWIASDDFDEELLHSIEWTSVKSPADGAFTIFTYPLKISESDYQYFGHLFYDGKIVELNPTDITADLDYEVFGAENWLSVFYYNILPVEKEGKKYYLLFGINADGKFVQRKIVDVLTFENGKPIFGAPLFTSKKSGNRSRNDVKNRLILDYSSDANVTLNYNPGLEMIVLDHLISRIGRIPGQGPTMLPDGSYVGYQWDGEYFQYVDKIYHLVSEEAPMPKPVLGKDKRDIIGKPQKSKN